MKALIVKVDGSKEVVEFEKGNLLNKAQMAVDGWVDVVRVNSFHLGEVSMFVNDEGLLIGLETNPFASALTADGVYGQRIVGDVLLAGGVDDEGDTVGLSDFQVEQLMLARVQNILTGEMV